MSEERKLTVSEVASLGDVVIVLTEGGMAGAAYIRGHRAPMGVEVDYGEKDDPPQTVRRATVKVGWTLKAWRNSSDEARKAVGEGTPWWQERSAARPLPEHPGDPMTQSPARANKKEGTE